MRKFDRVNRLNWVELRYSVIKSSIHIKKVFGLK